ncbi:helix-turn-helix domain-containing protein [Vibrio nigripulchritudo]|uniref:helix-turn-helix domain-containing protein n=1 Tax=Vibrio nigripulchritudo TaxID=28173 RepID=UPI0003B1FAFB|nr:AraC family transcriptional regulator [Vibrio nigripulchritudo]CCN69333.1 putative AraC-type DNA-binding domain-containing protein [Vibrio nigripulchritudo SFn118]
MITTLNSMNGFYRFQFDHIEMYDRVRETGFYGLDTSFGVIKVNQYELDSGLRTGIIDGKFNRPVEMYSEEGKAPKELTIFVCTGHCFECYLRSLGQRFLVSPSKVAVYFSDEASGYTRSQDEKFQGVSINVSLDAIQALVESYKCKELERYFSPAFQSQPRPFLYTLDATESIIAIAHQLLACSSETLAETLQYRGLSWQLLSLTLEEMAPKHTCSGKLNQTDVSKIHQARDILLNRMEAPPSLNELAHEVGLNDFKLKLGFKEIFNQTAFGCLHQQRMEKARSILLEQRSNIIQVANEVGYQNHGHFSVAFRKHFGLTPRDYLKLTQ